MSRVSTYLNFMGETEAAFEFYRTVFASEFQGPVIRFADMPAGPGMPELSDEEGPMIMHVEMPILAGHVIMGTDMLASMGHELRIGNNTTINLEPDTLDETQRLYDALSERGADQAPLMEMPWGYWGTCLDRFGIRWMFNFTPDA